MKPLKPTYRLKRRRILVKFLLGRPGDPIKWVKEKVVRLLGVWGSASARVRIEPVGEGVLVSVAREWADVVRGALVLGREEFVPYTVVSGTIKALKRKGFL